MPLLAVGLGATALGTASEIYGNEQSQSAINNVRNQFNQQQAQLEKQASAIAQNSANQNTLASTNANLAQGAATRNQLASALQQSAAPLAAGNAPLPTNAPTANTITTDPTARAEAVAQGTGNQTRSTATNASANLNAYGDLATQQNVNNQNAWSNLAPINAKAQGNAAILPVELQTAGQAGNTWSTLGSLASALGSVAMLGGAAGLGAATGTGVSAAQDGAIGAEMNGMGAAGMTGSVAGTLGSAIPMTASAANTAAWTANPGLWSSLMAGNVPALGTTLGATTPSLWSYLNQY